VFSVLHKTYYCSLLWTEVSFFLGDFFSSTSIAPVTRIQAERARIERFRLTFIAQMLFNVLKNELKTIKN